MAPNAGHRGAVCAGAFLTGCLYFQGVPNQEPREGSPDTPELAFPQTQSILCDAIPRVHPPTCLFALSSLWLPTYNRVLSPGHHRFSSSSHLRMLQPLTTTRCGPQLPIWERRNKTFLRDKKPHLVPSGKAWQACTRSPWA